MSEATVWIEALRASGTVWDAFKADLERRIQGELAGLLRVSGEDLLVQKGAALGLQRFLDDAMKVEREERHVAIRQERDTAAGVSRR
jgi:hypothetical protein